jgi:hypothetical protein
MAQHLIRTGLNPVEGDFGLNLLENLIDPQSHSYGSPKRHQEIEIRLADVLFKADCDPDLTFKGHIPFMYAECLFGGLSM